MMLLMMTMIYGWGKYSSMSLVLMVVVVFLFGYRNGGILSGGSSIILAVVTILVLPITISTMIIRKQTFQCCLNRISIHDPFKIQTTDLGRIGHTIAATTTVALVVVVVVLLVAATATATTTVAVVVLVMGSGFFYILQQRWSFKQDRSHFVSWWFNQKSLLVSVSLLLVVLPLLVVILISLLCHDGGPRYKVPFILLLLFTFHP